MNCDFRGEKMKDIKEVLEKLDQVTKQKDEAYAERNKVVAAFARVIHAYSWTMECQVGIAKHPDEDKDWESDWKTILVIESKPAGQMSWHFHDSEVYLLEGLPILKNYKWDGHTTEEKYKRLFEFTN